MGFFFCFFFLRGGGAASVLIGSVIDDTEFGNIVQEFSSSSCQTHTKSCIEKGGFNRKSARNQQDVSFNGLRFFFFFFL